jgi:hypothetical protein
MRPFGGRLLAADLVQFGEHDIAETWRGRDVKRDGTR